MSYCLLLWSSRDTSCVRWLNCEILLFEAIARLNLQGVARGSVVNKPILFPGFRCRIDAGIPYLFVFLGIR